MGNDPPMLLRSTAIKFSNALVSRRAWSRTHPWPRACGWLSPRWCSNATARPGFVVLVLIHTRWQTWSFPMKAGLPGVGILCDRSISGGSLSPSSHGLPQVGKQHVLQKIPLRRKLQHKDTADIMFGAPGVATALRHASSTSTKVGQ